MTTSSSSRTFVQDATPASQLTDLEKALMLKALGLRETTATTTTSEKKTATGPSTTDVLSELFISSVPTLLANPEADAMSVVCKAINNLAKSHPDGEIFGIRISTMALVARLLVPDYNQKNTAPVFSDPMSIFKTMFEAANMSDIPQPAAPADADAENRRSSPPSPQFEFSSLASSSSVSRRSSVSSSDESNDLPRTSETTPHQELTADETHATIRRMVELVNANNTTDMLNTLMNLANNTDVQSQAFNLMNMIQTLTQPPSTNNNNNEME